MEKATFRLDGIKKKDIKHYKVMLIKQGASNIRTEKSPMYDGEYVLIADMKRR